MSEGEFRAEMRYRMSLAVARAMLEEGAITEEEYSEIDTILLKKHRPWPVFFKQYCINFRIFLLGDGAFFEHRPRHGKRHPVAHLRAEFPLTHLRRLPRTWLLYSTRGSSISSWNPHRRQTAPRTRRR